MADRVGMSTKRMIPTMMLAIVIGVFSSLWALLYSAYDKGAAAGFMGYTGIPWESFNRLAHLVRIPTDTNYPEASFIGVGFVFSVAMMALRMRFLWWHLHPVGYALSTSGWIINYTWFSFLLSWFIKWAILKYGHLKAYRAAVPFFISLTLGEFTIGCLWNLLGIVFGFQSYGFFES